ncbi:MAG: glycosyltransferase [Acidimicrobiales bacterium]
MSENRLHDRVPVDGPTPAGTKTERDPLGDETSLRGPRLRVVFVGPYGPTRDGIARYSSELAAAMREEGCDIKVVTPRKLRSNGAEEVVGDLEGSRRKVRSLRRLVLNWSPDVVHVQFAAASFGGRLPALFRLLDGLPVRIVITVHDVTRDIALARWLGRRVYRHLVRSADCVLVHTAAAARLIGSLSPATAVRLIPHPVFPAPAQLASEVEIRRRFNLVDRDVILIFGFVHPHKGLADLVAAFERARRSSPAVGDRAVLVVAGAVRRRSGLFRIMEVPDRVYLAWVKMQVRHLGIVNHTVFTGYVEDGEVTAWFRTARAVVLPYRRVEQSGVLSLARAIGSPVIASDAGGFADGAGSSWTFPAGDREALAQLLSRVEIEGPPKASPGGAADIRSCAQAIAAIYRRSP